MMDDGAEKIFLFQFWNIFLDFIEHDASKTSVILRGYASRATWLGYDLNRIIRPATVTEPEI